MGQRLSSGPPRNLGESLSPSTMGARGGCREGLLLFILKDCIPAK
jgi:hypothetical protein